MRIKLINIGIDNLNCIFGHAIDSFFVAIQIFKYLKWLVRSDNSKYYGQYVIY